MLHAARQALAVNMFFYGSLFPPLILEPDRYFYLRPLEPKPSAGRPHGPKRALRARLSLRI